ncbi:hypothetical protein RIF29_17050 [Crotalaria pallida]|uniref:Uncharacterized protein n=1 Tax=Crotalaria pallida TaxID=3830 RepID=A0AAN9FNF6_CROPI
MEVYRKSLVAAPANVIYLSSILGHDGPVPVHKCDWKCENEHVCGNMYRCKLTGLTHICDKNCNQRILYDNHTSLCLASGHMFPLTQAEEQAVRGVRRKLDAENAPADGCGFKRRRDAQFHPSPFKRSFSAEQLLAEKSIQGYLHCYIDNLGLLLKGDDLIHIFICLSYISIMFSFHDFIDSWMFEVNVTCAGSGIGTFA